ncbi:hypothetical protein Leryth_010092 [Lithospermum erythrorhizon]|nr:hypothetical protein Leryth_010092 [Lithospermum erythrorhizon]
MKLLIVIKEQEFSMEVAPKESVLELKQKVQHILNIPPTLQILTVCGLELMDGLDMEDYPTISHGTKVVLTIKHCCSDQQFPISTDEQQCRKIRINVNFSARKMNIEVERSETVRSLKEKIHIIDGTPMKRMSLVLGGRELEEDYRYLSEYGVSEYSEIIVCLKNMSRMVADPPSRKLEVVVQTSSSLMNGARIPLEMNDLNTVNELREMLLSRKILPFDDYIFIHKQRIMKDNCSLRWHGVDNGDNLYVFKGTVC